MIPHFVIILVLVYFYFSFRPILDKVLSNFRGTNDSNETNLATPVEGEHRGSLLFDYWYLTKPCYTDKWQPKGTKIPDRRWSLSVRECGGPSQAHLFFGALNHLWSCIQSADWPNGGLEKIWTKHTLGPDLVQILSNSRQTLIQFSPVFVPF